MSSNPNRLDQHTTRVAALTVIGAALLAVGRWLR